jgi:hypothetical protein
MPRGLTPPVPRFQSMRALVIVARLFLSSSRSSRCAIIWWGRRRCAMRRFRAGLAGSGIGVRVADQISRSLTPISTTVSAAAEMGRPPNAAIAPVRRRDQARVDHTGPWCEDLEHGVGECHAVKRLELALVGKELLLEGCERLHRVGGCRAARRDRAALCTTSGRGCSCPCRATLQLPLETHPVPPPWAIQTARRLRGRDDGEHDGEHDGAQRQPPCGRGPTVGCMGRHGLTPSKGGCGVESGSSRRQVHRGTSAAPDPSRVEAASRRPAGRTMARRPADRRTSAPGSRSCAR